MTKIFDLAAINSVLDDIDVVSFIEAGFVAYSHGEVVVPPVGEMLFEEPRGEAHIKYGYIQKDDYYVVKIASGFYDNHLQGLPTNSGLMLLFSQKTGALSRVLLDEGHLTDERTAAAGALASRTMAPPEVKRIGILGSGVQARLQAKHHANVFPDAEFLVWGRDPEITLRRDISVFNNGYGWPGGDGEEKWGE